MFVIRLNRVWLRRGRAHPGWFASPASLVAEAELEMSSGSEMSHRTINHSEGVYVAGDVHTGTLEGFSSSVKRGISGMNHAVSARRLQGYLNEYNRRDDGRAQFLTLLRRLARP